MRMAMRECAVVLAAMSAVACTDYVTDSGASPSAPTGLTYQLQPSGSSGSPSGILLRWDANTDPNIAVYHVHSRAGANDVFDLRGSTTSPSFHDDGQPDLEYYVTAEGQNQQESSPSASIVVDERLRLPFPTALTSLSLNGAIHLSWTDNAYTSDTSAFWHYRIYSTSYDLDNNVCGTSWTLEGTTVGPVFLAGALPNGRPRCFGVSAVSVEGYESLWSPLRYDTPRPDAHNQIIFTSAADAAHSGFRFFLDANNDGQAGPLELGLITAGSSPSIDFTITKDVSGNLLLTPVRAAASVRLFAAGPITDLTDIDIAPVSGYARIPLIAQPGRGYVFEMNEQTAPPNLLRYGAIRVTALGPDYVVFDWSYQTDAGNPELLRVIR